MIRLVGSGVAGDVRSGEVIRADDHSRGRGANQVLHISRIIVALRERLKPASSRETGRLVHPSRAPARRAKLDELPVAVGAGRIPVVLGNSAVPVGNVGSQHALLRRNRHSGASQHGRQGREDARKISETRG
jgi:hypothetical protein